MPGAILALDIGGANLKAAHSAGLCRLRPFALWKDAAGLARALRELLDDLPAFDLLAVTMTGELCDCYSTKREGVQAILDAVERVAGPAPVQVWRNDGRLVDLPTARDTPLQVAAANWLALARFAGRFVPHGPALVIDVGSTTTDLIPMLDGRPVPRGRTDPERLRCRELLYTGVRRTPLCAMLSREVAAELFATTLDVYLVLRKIAENPEDRDTADGRPATIDAAYDRLARMLCADRETATREELGLLAARVWRRQTMQLRAAIQDVARGGVAVSPTAFVLAGSGAFLAGELLEQEEFSGARVLSLDQELGPEASAAACAHALAVIASERTGDASDA